MKKKTEQPYKMGNLIYITERKCSEKVQPQIKINTYYLVIRQDRIKSGAITLTVAEFAKMVKEGLKDPHGKINPHHLMKCNEERFGWVRKTQKELLSKFNKFKEEFYKQQEEKEEEILKEKFTEQERIRLAYHPYIYAELAWYYAQKAVDIARERRIGTLKKISRNVEKHRADFLSELRKKMTPPIINYAQNKVYKMLEDNWTDFFIFYTTVKNSINYQFVGIPDDDIKAYAYISMLCFNSQQRLDESNIEIIRKRLGVASKHESFKYMKELNQCMLGYIGGFKIEYTSNIQAAVAIMEKHVNALSL